MTVRTTSIRTIFTKMNNKIQCAPLLQCFPEHDHQMFVRRALFRALSWRGAKIWIRTTFDGNLLLKKIYLFGDLYAFL